MAKAAERTLRDGNGRAARLARWLTDPPYGDRFDVLILENKTDGEWTRVQMWPRASVNQGLAPSIDATVTELANELGAYLTARVVWYDSERDAYGTEHALRVQPDDLESQAFSGDAQSIAIQNQRHQERIVGVHIGGFQSAISALRETNVDLRDISRRTSAENDRLRDELADERHRSAELEADNARMVAQLEEACALAERYQEAAASNDNAQTAQVLQMIQQLTARTTAQAS